MEKEIKYSIAVFSLLAVVAVGFLVFLAVRRGDNPVPAEQPGLPTPNYSYPLSDRSSGVLSVQKVYSSTTSRDEIKLFFEDDISGEKAVACDNFSYIPGLMSDWEPFLYGKNIYYFDGREIESMGIFTGETDNFPIPLGEEEIVNSFFVRGDKIYYLAGPSCLGYMEECNLSLRSYDLKSGEIENLADGSKSRDIIGFGKGGNYLYLEQSVADAMCGSGNYERFSFSDLSLEKIGSWRECVGDSRKEEGEQPEIDGLSKTRYMVLKGGSVFVPEKKRHDGTEAVFIRYNSADYQLKDPERTLGGFIVEDGIEKKTIENGEKGLAMSIPGDWEVSDYNNKDSISFFRYSGDLSLEFNMDVFIKEKEITLEKIGIEETAKQEPSLSYKTEEIEVAGMEALKITMSGEAVEAISVKLPANGKLYTFIFYPGSLVKKEREMYFDEFLASVSVK